MKRLAAILIALAAWFCAAPAFALIGVTQIGNIVSASSLTTLSIPTTADCPVGSYVIVGGTFTNTSAWGFTDSSSSSYASPSNFVWNTSDHTIMSFAKVGTDLPAPVTGISGSIAASATTVNFTSNPGTLVVGQVITGTGVAENTLIAGGISQWNGSAASATIGSFTGTQGGSSGTLTVSSGIKASWTTTSRVGLVAICVSNLAASLPLDITAAGSGSVSSSSVASFSTGTLSQANEIVVAIWGDIGTYSAWNEATNFTGGGFSTISSNSNVRLAYWIVSATTSVPYSSSWTTAHPNGAQMWTFKDNSGGVACRGALLLLGVGGC